MIKENNNKPVDLGRRRLAKGGVAVSAVLATLASKNALAAFPYQCGLSGKLSNNTSPHGPKTGESCELGNTAGYWETSLLNDTRTFNAVFGVSLYFYKSSTQEIGNSALDDTPATLLQVLKINKTPSARNKQPDELEFAKIAVVIYLNAEYLAGGSHYPLNKQQVIDMFKAVVNDSSYTTETSAGFITLQTQDIRDYFMQLYPTS
jgi:hypothetical protein